jgi:putative heme-binding domain-containing protein
MYKPLAVLTLFILAAGFAVAPPAAAQVQSLAAQSGALVNPHTAPEDAEAGAKSFRRHCSTCHGRNAEGFRGPNLTTGSFRHGNSDAALFRNILGGVGGTGMGGVYLPDRQIWQIISYLRSLSQTREEAPIEGDPVRGKALFLEKGECATCHRVNGQGGRRGMDLTEVGWRRSLDHIRAAILKPSEVIESRFRLIQMTRSNGETVDGLLLNEDTYSIQFMDENENLRSIYKSQLRAVYKPDLSLMPDYEGAFTKQELDDLIAYLHSLDGEPDHD